MLKIGDDPVTTGDDDTTVALPGTAGNDVLVDSDFVVPKNQDVNGKSFSVWFFTKNKQWLDVIEFKLEGEGEI